MSKKPKQKVQNFRKKHNIKNNKLFKKLCLLNCINCYVTLSEKRTKSCKLKEAAKNTKKLIFLELSLMNIVASNNKWFE